MSRRKIIIGCIIIAALSAAINFSPLILRLAHSVGYGVAANELQNIQVEMNNQWLPILSPGSILEPLLKRGDRPQLLFIRIDQSLSRTADNQRYVIFSRLPSPPEETMYQAGDEMRFTWGSVRLLKPALDIPQYESVYMQASNLLITASELSDIRDIERIQKLNN